ncbi:MAG: hypothetical protein ACI8UO_003645 [Verrucomicrobiales bacterium]|jgi:hypothetical protein
MVPKNPRRRNRRRTDAVSRLTGLQRNVTRFRKTASYNDSDSYRWVRSRGQYWKILLGRFSLLFHLGVLAATIPLLVTLIWISVAKFILISLWIAVLIIWITYYQLKRSIFCDICGYNPSKSRRSGRTLNDPQIEDRLLKLDRCPVCSPKNKSEEHRENSSPEPLRS